MTQAFTVMYIFLFFFNSKNITQIFNINADNIFFQDIEKSETNNKNNLSNYIKKSRMKIIKTIKKK